MISRELRLQIFKNIIEDRDDEAELIGVFEWLKHFRSRPRLESEKVPLCAVMLNNFGSRDVMEKNLEDEFVFIKSTLHEREVKSWCQPLMYSQYEHLCGLIVRESQGKHHALLQLIEEPGNNYGFQIGPTVQTNVTRSNLSIIDQPYFVAFKSLKTKNVLFDVFLSEEGGRFYKDKKRYVAILLRDEEIDNNYHHYKWVSLGTFQKAVQTENAVNIFARTLLSILV